MVKSPGPVEILKVWKSGSFTTWQSGNLAVVVSGIDGISPEGTLTLRRARGRRGRERLGRARFGASMGFQCIFILF